MIGAKLPLTARVSIALGLTSFVMAGAFVGLSQYGLSKFGNDGFISAAVACGVCWFSGIIALGMMLLFRDPQQAVQGVMLGMLFRMGLPLAVSVMLQSSQSVLLKAGIMDMMIGAYLLGLCVETLLAWWMIETSSAESTTRVAKAS